MVVDRLIKRMRELGAPIVVGLDPRMDEIPEYIKENSKSYLLELNPYMTETEQKMTDFVNAFWSVCYRNFLQEIIDSIHGLVPAVKLQSAMFERFGHSGVSCYHYLVHYATSKLLTVIGDIKRSDIASSAEAYSAGHIGFDNMMDYVTSHSPVHFVTLNPYLGKDSIDPFISDCKKFDRGLFVLVKTSNKGSADIQDVLLDNGKPLYTHVAKLVSNWGEDSTGEYGYSRVGAVVGATHPSEALEIRKLMPHTFFLVPGYGAQGASGKDLKDLWIKESYGMIVNSSREITGAYQSDRFKTEEYDFAKAAKEAVIAMKDDLGAYMP